MEENIKRIRSLDFLSYISPKNQKKISSSSSSSSKNKIMNKKQSKIFLYFKSSKLEKKFYEFFYGKNYSIRLCISFIIGSLMYGQFALSVDMPWPIWWISDVIIAIFWFIFAWCCMIPCVVNNPMVFEGIIAIGNIITCFRTGIHDIYIEGIYPPYGPLKEGAFAFELAIFSIVRPRITIVLPCCVINMILYTIYLPLVQVLYHKNSTDLRLIVSLFSYYAAEITCCTMIYFLNGTTRHLFLKNKELEEKREELQFENLKSVHLLKNILPDEFIDQIKSGELDKNQGVLMKFVNSGSILISDIVNFTKWASLNDIKTVTDALNYHFSFFDTICKSLKLEKVKTVGDAFYCYGIQESDYLNIVLLGISLIKSVECVNKYLNIDLKIRVGAGCGKFNIVVTGYSKSAINFDVYGNLFFKVQKLEETSKQSCVHVDHLLHSSTKEFFKFHPFVVVFNDENNEKESTYLVENDGLDEELNDKLQKMIDNCKKKFLIKSDDEREEDDYERELDPIMRLTESFNGGLNVPDDDDIELKNQVIVKVKMKTKLNNILRRRRGKVDKKKVKKETSCCISETGLIYPIVMFKKFKDEKQSNLEIFKKSKVRNIQVFLFFLLFNIVLITYYLTTRINEFNRFNVLLIVTYVSSFINVVSMMIVVCMGSSLKVYVSIICFNLFQMRLQFLCLLFIPVVQNTDICRYFILVLLTMIIFESSLHVIVKYMFVSTDLLILVVRTIILLNKDQISVDQIVLDFQIAAVGAFTVFTFSTTNEIIVKLTYQKKKIIMIKNDILKQERDKNENLIFSVLPRQIVKRIYDKNFQSFSSTAKYSFVIFITLENFIENLSKCNDNNVIKQIIIFLSSIFMSFDKNVEEGDCMTIKKTQEVYLFISKENNIDKKEDEKKNNFKVVLKIVEKCIKDFKSHVENLHNSLKKVGLTDKRIGIKSGISFGNYGSGVLGTSKFLYDVFGDKINLSARLSSISKNCRICICSNNIDSSIYDEKECVIQDRGKIFLKGKGMIQCAFIHSKEESRE